VKKLLFIAICVLQPFMGSSQENITLNFQAIDSFSQENLCSDSINIVNLTNGDEITLFADEHSITIPLFVGVDNITFDSEDIFSLSCYPNPFLNSTISRIGIKTRSELYLVLNDELGNKLAEYSGIFSEGLHEFEIYSSCSDLLFLTVVDGQIRKTAKLINMSSGSSTNNIKYLGLSGISSELKTRVVTSFVYTLGDELQYTIYVNGYYNQVVLDSPTTDSTYFIEMTTLGLPTVTTDPVTNITHSSATSGGNVTNQGLSPVMEKGVCWSTGTTPTVLDNKTTDGTGVGSFVSSISGLSANTMYYTRAYATNSNGTDYGSTKSFTTEGEPIVVTLDNVDPNIQAYQTWTESGVILNLQEINGHASFGIEPDRIWLYPCLLHADLSGLQGTISHVEVDIYDQCGQACTVAKLFDGGVEIAQASNLTLGLLTLYLSSPVGYIPDVLTVSSYEGQVLEIRIIFQTN